ncbi:MFS transporter [Sphingomonas sp. RB56-2]|uniref:MFS transporter n=1 Tax=Sphingomonas brevis TaxID=2908206 RepID=A0ABT0S9P9_9SPHN|nr:MFS transporter [Sphingomonas brevis]
MTDIAISRPKVQVYAWVIFALTFGLLISDYMARQVLNAVFPLLKAEWALSDSQLGLLSGVVAIMVGLLTFPLSLAADRWGRVKSLTAMAVLWSLATLLCAVAANYEQMLAGRVLVGVGEAAYGSVGIAVVVSAFPSRLRATLSAAFMAGGLLGQVLGVGIGGAVAAAHGWRMAFMIIALSGLALAILYPILVGEQRLARLSAAAGQEPYERKRALPNIGSLFAGRTLKCAYVGSGLQLFVAGALPAWLPTYFNRYYELPVDGAASLAALYLAICGIGMVACGVISDRLFSRPEQRVMLAAAYSIGCAILLAVALAVPAGPAQLALLGLAIFFAAATAGPAGAMVAGLTPAAIHGTAFATLTLANNFLGLAPGPIVTGWLADRVGLLGALQVLPLASVAAALVFLFARKSSRAAVAFAE